MHMVKCTRSHSSKIVRVIVCRVACIVPFKACWAKGPEEHPATCPYLPVAWWCVVLCVIVLLLGCACMCRACPDCKVGSYHIDCLVIGKSGAYCLFSWRDALSVHTLAAPN